MDEEYNYDMNRFMTSFGCIPQIWKKYNQNLANFKDCDWAVKGYKKVGGVLHILKGILTKEIGMPISFHI